MPLLSDGGPSLVRFCVGLEVVEDVPLSVKPHAHLELRAHEELRVVRVRLLDHYLLNPHLLGMELCLELGPELPAGRRNSTREAVIGTTGRAESGSGPTFSVGMRGLNPTETLRRGRRKWGDG